VLFKGELPEVIPNLLCGDVLTLQLDVGCTADPYAGWKFGPPMLIPKS